ncbi:MAG: DUF4926 domain-containing protein [Stellaceae bacterium]
MLAKLQCDRPGSCSLARVCSGSRPAMSSRRPSMPHRKKKIRRLDVVALMTDLPERGLLRGQVGTVVEVLAPGVSEVEFSDDEGRTYAQLAVPDEQLMVLRYRPQAAA